jgi:hypothetical protein
MAYDLMGNYSGDYETADPTVETEEQKRLRLQREREQAALVASAQQMPAMPPPGVGPAVRDAANTEVQSQTVKTYGDGSQEEITKKQIPAGSDNYSKYTGQQESGNNPNIGFHYPANAQGQRKSSAYGTYGITANAYKDIQANNPAFANRPLESLSPEEQTQANETYRGVLGKQLQAKGVEPTEQNTRLAHLLGAQGAARYLQNRTVSPEAAAANGGQAKLQQIADARMAGQPAPASGAVSQQMAPPAPVAQQVAQPAPVAPQSMPPAPAPAAPAAVSPEQALAPGSAYSLAQGGGQPGIQVPGMTSVPLTQGTQLPEAQQRFQDIQDDPGALLAYRNDTAIPQNLRRRAGERATELLNSERNLSRAEARRDELIASGDGKAIANAMQGRGAKGEEGNWLKFVFLHALDPNLANAEAEKLGLLPSKFEQSTITNADGTQTAIEIKKSSSGKIQEAYRMDGTPLTTKELNTLNSGANLDIVGGTYVNDATGEVGRVVTDKKNPANSYVQTDKGRKPMTGFRPQASGGSLEQQNVTQQQQLMNKLHYEPAIAAATKGASTLAEYNALNGTNFSIAGRDSLGRPLLVDQRNNQMLQAPVAQAAGAQAQAPATGNVPAVTGGTPAERDAAKKRLEAEQQASRDVGTAEQKQFVEKVMPEIQKKGDDGKFIADTRRTQVGMLTGANSAIMGIYRGSGTSYDKARAVIRDAVSGAYSGEEGGVKLSEDLRGISIPEEQLSALKEFTQLNTGINAKTLAENAGEGPKSDADMRLNQAANMTNIGDLPAFAALTGLTRSQFAGDVNKRKQDFLNSNRDQYKTQSQLEGAWGKEKDLLNRQYESIYRARLNYIDGQMVQKFGQDWRKKPSDDTQAFYRNASIHSFNVLPTPNYDAQTQKFVYPTQQSKMAAMRAITGK